MIYSNPEFLALLLTTIVLYFLFPSHRMRFNTLLIASLLFYAWAGAVDTLIFLAVVSVTWLSVFAASKSLDPKKKKNYLIFGITIMSLHLFFWKYASWLAAKFTHHRFHIPLPVGISFFTLQGIAYLVDYGKNEAEFIPAAPFLLFKSFFAQLVAGPIVRVHQLYPQLQKLPTPKLDDIFVGISFFTLGFFKKLAVADRVAPFVDAVFAHPDDYSRAILLKATLGYTIQIWADFSGYVDMGRGAARILGIQLPENFLSPYLSRTPSEFWRRWHITLSQWIRDYIYIPLGGSKGTKMRVFFVAMATMGISGLWHGASDTFILWGLYHGVLLVAERGLRGSTLNKKFQLVPEQLRNISLGLLTFVSVTFGWILFRSQEPWRLRHFLKGIWHNTGEAAAPIVGKHDIWWAAVFCLLAHILYYYSFSREKFVFSPKLKEFQNPLASSIGGAVLGLSIAILFVATIFLRSTLKTNAFIYFQF